MISRLDPEPAPANVRAVQDRFIAIMGEISTALEASRRWNKAHAAVTQIDADFIDDEAPEPVSKTPRRGRPTGRSKQRKIGARRRASKNGRL